MTAGHKSAENQQRPQESERDHVARHPEAAADLRARIRWTEKPAKGGHPVLWITGELFGRQHMFGYFPKDPNAALELSYGREIAENQLISSVIQAMNKDLIEGGCAIEDIPRVLRSSDAGGIAWHAYHCKEEQISMIRGWAGGTYKEAYYDAMKKGDQVRVREVLTRALIQNTVDLHTANVWWPHPRAAQ